MNPDMTEELARITHAAKPFRNSSAVRWVNPDGSRGGARVNRRDWPGGYWPPGVGDLVRVDGAKVTMRMRPRRRSGL